MAYLEIDAGVRKMELGFTRSPARIPVVDYFEFIHIKVYDRPFTGGDDVLLCERMIDWSIGEARPWPSSK